MTKVIVAPSKEDVEEGISVFLAGTIDMGPSKDWQAYLAKKIIRATDNVVIFNPRRDSWDSSWEQTTKNEEFVEQVSWELEHLEKVDYIFMYFAPDSKSPISLLELGAFADRGNMIVCCPPEFYRSGNVEIFCNRYGVQFFNNLYDAVEELRQVLLQHEPPLTFIDDNE